MAAALEDTPVTYEDLVDIEHAFDDAETDVSEFSSISRDAGKPCTTQVLWKGFLLYHVRSFLPAPRELASDFSTLFILLMA